MSQPVSGDEPAAGAQSPGVTATGKLRELLWERAVENEKKQVRIQALARRVDELEREMQECRRLNVRLAELVDVVQELLLPLPQRDDEKMLAFIDDYARHL